MKVTRLVRLFRDAWRGFYVSPHIFGPQFATVVMLGGSRPQRLWYVIKNWRRA